MDATLTQENLSLKNEIASLRQQIEKAQSELRLSKLQIEYLKRRLFGPIAEKIPLDDKQQELLLETVSPKPLPVTNEVLEEEQSAKTIKRRPVRHPIPSHVETETVRLEPAVKGRSAVIGSAVLG